MSARHLRKLLVIVAALLGGVGTSLYGLQEFAFTDYEAEMLPASQLLIDGDIVGFMSRLPWYSGAAILEAPLTYIGGQLPGDRDLWAWRFQAIPGVLMLTGIGMALGLRVASDRSSPRATVMGVVIATCIAGTPVAALALEMGHPEELLVTGLVVVSVFMVESGRPTAAAVVLGVALASKPWAALALPILLLDCQLRASIQRLLVAALVSLALLLPVVAATGISDGLGVVAAPTATGGIFKPANLFWFAGPTNPRWGAEVVAPVNSPGAGDWSQRLEPDWVRAVSRPAILLVAVVALVMFRRSRADFESNDMFLFLATIFWWRCLLDTWNNAYYGLVAIVLIAVWQANRREFPVGAIAITLATWISFQQVPGVSMSPDVGTVVYLAWAVPVGLIMAQWICAPEASRRTRVRISTFARLVLPNLSRLVARQSNGT